MHHCKTFSGNFGEGSILGVWPVPVTSSIYKQNLPKPSTLNPCSTRPYAQGVKLAGLNRSVSYQLFLSVFKMLNDSCSF